MSRRNRFFSEPRLTLAPAVIADIAAGKGTQLKAVSPKAASPTAVVSAAAALSTEMGNLPTPTERLHAAVLAGDVLAVAEALSAARGTVGGAASVNARDAAGRTALVLAAMRGNTAMLAVLLAQGADLTMRCANGHSLNDSAAAPSDITTTTTPTAAGRSPREGCALHWAVYHGHYNAVRLLLSHASFLAAVTSSESMTAWGETLLHTVARRGTVKMLALLLLFKGLRQQTELDREMHTPAEVAQNDEMYAILTAGNGVFLGSTSSEDAVTAAAYSNIYDARKLYENRPGALQAAPDGAPLLRAIERNDLEMAMTLLSFGVDPTRAPHLLSGVFAGMLGNRDLAEMIVSHLYVSRVQRLGKSKNGENLLHLATRVLHAENRDWLHLLLALPGAAAMLSEVNNQGQRPASFVSDPTILSVLENHLARITGATTLPARAPAVLCAVCLLPPEGGAVYTCDCKASFCRACFLHMASSALNSGQQPGCCNTGCPIIIPMATIQSELPREQTVTVSALRFNRKIHMGENRQNCCVCHRANDLAPLVSAATGCILTCGHCNVNYCVVCETVAPRSALSMPDDVAFHAPCLAKFQLFAHHAKLTRLMHEMSMRRCVCKEEGVKDDACTHITCTCNKRYCYVCGRMDISHNGAWQQDPKCCPQYLYLFAEIDPRLVATRCPNNCTQSCANCNRLRDRRAQVILSTMRVRAHILNFAATIGKATFVAVVDKFNMRSTIDLNFFAPTGFPWEGPDLPTWDSYEPEGAPQAFYKARHEWIGLPPPPPTAAELAARQAIAAGGVPPPPPLPMPARQILPLSPAILAQIAATQAAAAAAEAAAAAAAALAQAEAAAQAAAAEARAVAAAAAAAAGPPPPPPAPPAGFLPLGAMRANPVAMAAAAAAFARTTAANNPTPVPRQTFNININYLLRALGRVDA